MADLRLLDEEDLVDRLAGCEKPLVVVAGAGVTSSSRPGDGVPDSAALVEKVRARRWPRRLAARLEAALDEASSMDRYGVAFRFLIERAGLDAANDIVRQAVESAREATAGAADRLTPQGWRLTPGAAALGRFVAQRPGCTVVTTVFDPLIEVALLRAGARCRTEVMAVDGHLDQSNGEGVRVVHLNGFWRGDTLHSDCQRADRPRLHQALQGLFRGCLVLVVGVGPGDAALLGALGAVARTHDARCDVLWAFAGTDAAALAQEQAPVLAALAPAVGAGRAFYYGGVDAHRVLPALAQEVAPRPFLDPEVLVGRAQLCAHLVKRVARDRASVQLLGLTQMGTTAVLRWLHRALRDEHGARVAFVDALGLGGRSPAHFVQAIGDALGARGATWQRLSADRAVPDDRAAVAALEALLPCTVLVDHADELALPGHGFTPTFLEQVRAFGQAGRLTWVSASRADLRASFEHSGLVSRFLNDAEQCAVGRLEDAAVTALGQVIGPARALEVEAEAGRWATTLGWWARRLVDQPGATIEALRPAFDAWAEPLFALWRPYLPVVREGEAGRLARRVATDRGLLLEGPVGARPAGAAWGRYVERG